MKTVDARKLPAAAIEEKRRQAVRLRSGGMTNIEIGAIVGVAAETVGRWFKKYDARGEVALIPQRRGRAPGAGSRLTRKQEATIQKLIVDKTPDQLRFDFALWTRAAVREVILRETGVDLPIRTVGHYLARWGMTPQKPTRRAYEQRSSEVQRWLEEEYPAIRARAILTQAEIYWGDETGLRTDCHYERGYAPQGRTPVIRLPSRRESINMISAVSNQGKVRFKFYKDTMDARCMIDFLARLIRDAKRRVFLIVDNLRVHHSKIVREWLAKHRKEIEVFYLPSYSPELNPDEYLNGDLKRNVHSGLPPRNAKSLQQKATLHMRRLQRSPEHVKSFFRHRSIRYAA